MLRAYSWLHIWCLTRVCRLLKAYPGCVYLANFWLESGFSNVFQANLEVDKRKAFFKLSLDMGISKDAKMCVLNVTYSQNHVSERSINAKLFWTSHTNMTTQVLWTSMCVKLTSEKLSASRVKTAGQTQGLYFESWRVDKRDIPQTHDRIVGYDSGVR